MNSVILSLVTYADILSWESEATTFFASTISLRVIKAFHDCGYMNLDILSTIVLMILKSHNLLH